MDFRCVECGYRINKELFVQYSPGNIRLMKCDNCRAVADEYIECEIMILLIDLILHKPKAYRHLLYNMIHLQAANLECLFWKLALGFLLLDAYRILLLNRSEEEWGLSMLMDLLFGNFVFLCTLLLMTRFFLDESAGVSRYKDILFTIFISSYFKIFLIAMMVWEFPLSVLFIIDMFVLSSNTVALKVITDSAMNKCMSACFCAYAVKLFCQTSARHHLPRSWR
ncbi:protein ARV 2 isoform X2 [Cornus florida]|uniref:protein ARV 2 isoform X2 n=1 Tax=Cornus florida TaxID=4283 RepID=UPI0028A077FF|nr:protein ARV 2 isoform X2 [Cornus florida]